MRPISDPLSFSSHPLPSMCRGALHNYIQSVCYCPERVDTWAGLALARAQNIMKKLDQVSGDVTLHHHDITYCACREMYEVGWRLCCRNKSLLL